MNSSNETVKAHQHDDAFMRDQARVLAELLAALATVAANSMGGSGATTREVLDALPRCENATAQDILVAYIAVDRAKAAAQRCRRSARYDWQAWAEVSRLAAEWLITALRAMRQDMECHRGDRQPRGGVEARDRGRP